MPPLSLYVHFPWCLRKCPYCDFNSHKAPDAIPEQRYVDGLLEDLDAQLALAGNRRALRSIFIGGGTPSLVSGAAVSRLLAGVRARCAMEPAVEISLEANPGAVDSAHFAAYRGAGVNRLSIGVQSLCARHLTALGRVHDPAQALEAVRIARAAGFDNINLDMMFALPGQTLRESREDLARLLALEPEHVSYYQLTLEPNTAFAHDPPPLPDDDLACDMQEQGIEMLAASGYRRYEISAYARAGRRCRHNLNYWRFGDYLGIGAGAHGKLTAESRRVERIARPRHPDAYLKSPAAPGTVSIPDDADLLLEFALNALRLVDGVEAGLLIRRTGLPAARSAPMRRRARATGLLDPSPTRFGPTVQGLRFLNDLIACFAPEA
ncbi:MAG: radical SAM family heme chaperone HemW [Thiohalocapsa sp.]|nr:radical SAM family heme chaperone HemW [Thiohalocapsa sp.]MCF7988895.1 radical SAM family heme chaperone HemW [Thiohalocapsa sp.]